MTKKKLKKAKIEKYKGSDLKHDPKYFFNREISWLEFNGRVLGIACDPQTPILERLKFAQIYTANLDEFYMKRVGGLKEQIESENSYLSIDGKTPEEQLVLIREKVHQQQLSLAQNFENEISPMLENENIFLCKWDELSLEQHEFLKDYFLENLFPILTPLAVDYSHPFPFLSNLSKSFAVRMRRPFDNESIFARVKIPDKVPQWVRVPALGDEIFCFVSIDEIIANNIHVLFSGMEIEDLAIFRVTRSASWDEDDEDAEDLLELVEEGIKERKFSPVIRLEVEAKASGWIKKFLCDHMHIALDDIYIMPGITSYLSFSEIYKIDRPKLKFKPWVPKTATNLQLEEGSIFTLIRKQDILIHHPYESFSSSVEKFIQQAARDPEVMGIKITLYRTNKRSQIIKSLIYAAQTGKQVACVIELKARFDEERNIEWANKLIKAGVHVSHGIGDLKTHSKMALVVRNENGKINKYVHVGTGNYNSDTSKLYTDHSLLTCNKKITNEILEAFNFLTGYSLKNDYKTILLAPINMRERFLQLIERETKHGKNGRIIAKMNQLEDIRIMEALYNASRAGVQITLIVRGFCCLRPCDPEFSANIRVLSIVGPFLEHSRIFYFANGSNNFVDGDFFIGSADWMYRNLTNRVEVVVPILDQEFKRRLSDQLELEISDNMLAWDCTVDGTYIKVATPADEKKQIHSQNLLRR